MRLRRWWSVSIDGAPIGHSGMPLNVGQAAIGGPSKVARDSGRVRSAFLGKIRMAMATGSAMPSTSGLPTNIAKQVNASGGPLAFAQTQPDTQKKVEKIRRRIKRTIQK